MTRPLRLALAFGLVLAACEEEPSLSDGGTAPTDLGGGDFGVFEMGTSDLGTEDVASTDLGPGDVGPQDHGPTDLGYADLGAEDAGPADLGTEPGVLALVLGSVLTVASTIAIYLTVVQNSWDFDASTCAAA